MTKFVKDMITSDHIVIFDINGTIADCTHRLHFVKDGNRDWDSFFANVDLDAPIKDNILMLKLMWELGFVIILASGRSSIARDKTVAWLAKYEIPYHDMFMRSKKDHRPDYITKQEMLTNIRTKYFKKKIFCVFDDRDQVVKMWRSNNIRCYQVNKGDF